MTPTRLDRYKKGKRAELFCAVILFLKGYRILKTRYKAPVGEVDLIVQRGQSLVFIEVKARETYQKGVEAITPTAQKRIRRAGEHFLMKHPKYINLSMRFDVMVVSGISLPYHVPNAWS